MSSLIDELLRIDDGTVVSSEIDRYGMLETEEYNKTI
jgi:hypothetical protein